MNDAVAVADTVADAVADAVAAASMAIALTKTEPKSLWTILETRFWLNYKVERFPDERFLHGIYESKEEAEVALKVIEKKRIKKFNKMINDPNGPYPGFGYVLPQFEIKELKS